jgi:hypothetical protein
MAQNAFVKSFLPGLVLGLIVGALAGAFLPPLLESRDTFDADTAVTRRRSARHRRPSRSKRRVARWKRRPRSRRPRKANPWRQWRRDAGDRARSGSHDARRAVDLSCSERIDVDQGSHARVTRLVKQHAQTARLLGVDFMPRYQAFEPPQVDAQVSAQASAQASVPTEASAPALPKAQAPQADTPSPALRCQDADERTRERGR